MPKILCTGSLFLGERCWLDLSVPKLVRDAVFPATQWLFSIEVAYGNLDMRDKIDKAYKSFKEYIDAHM